MQFVRQRFLKKYLPPRKLFSIITPVYNCGPKIERKIESVWSQKLHLFEHIIIDGGSSDQTLASIKKSRYPFTLVSEKDTGVYDAMNKGIDLACGKYLYFLGGGDRLEPGILEKIAPLMPRQKLAFVYGNVFWEGHNKIYDGEFSKEKMKAGSNICQQAIFYERRIFDLLGKFETRFSVLADHAMNIRCFGRNEISKIYIEAIIARFEGDGLCVHQPDLTFAQELPNLIKTYLK
jgi:glycosyltransferase involved in cell wall biosynthesis